MYAVDVDVSCAWCARAGGWAWGVGRVGVGRREFQTRTLRGREGWGMTHCEFVGEVGRNVCVCVCFGYAHSLTHCVFVRNTLTGSRLRLTLEGSYDT